MSDALTPDSPQLGVWWCPGCAPERDPSVEILITDYCQYHKPDLGGCDDGRVVAGAGIIGNSDTDQAAQIGMAALLRG